MTRFRSFNVAVLGISLVLVLLACRKLSMQPSVAAIFVAVVAGIAVIVTWHHLRTRRGVVLIGCTRRSFDHLQQRLLKDKPLGATYRAGRGIGLVRELYAHWRDKSVDDAALISAVKEHFSAHPQQLTPRDSVLLLAWACALFIAVLVVAWLLLA